MEDERTVPAFVSVYKAEVWRHLGFCGNVRPGTAAQASPRFRRLPRPVLKSLRAGYGGRQGRCAAAAFSHVGGRFVQLGRCSRCGLGDSTRNINTN